MSYVTVSNYRIQIGVAEYTLCSSDGYGEVLGEADWSPAIRHQVTACRREGAEKGRVLYLLEHTAKGKAPVAVLAYHIESSRELMIRAAESALAVKDREREFIAILLLCTEAILRQHPSRQGGARVVWPGSKDEARAIRENYGFESAGNSPDGRQLSARRVPRT
jgi:hypothetical protein